MVFECNEAELPEPRNLRTALDSICTRISAGQSQGTKPFRWRLRPFIFGFDDDTSQAGIGVCVWASDEWSDLQMVSQKRYGVMAGFGNAYRKAVAHACKKFESYPKDRHILLVQFLGDDAYLLDEDVKEIVRGVGLPPLIDEVWAAYHEWQDEENYEIGWQRLK